MAIMTAILIANKKLGQSLSNKGIYKIYLSKKETNILSNEKNKTLTLFLLTKTVSRHIQSKL
jgi:hypothetical protein